MRIISGKYRSRKLIEGNSKITRPTMDRIKEAFFSSIGNKIHDSLFVDLFAGTGSIGLEAISRGCLKSYFVDNNNEAIKTIKENINLLSINNYEIFFGNYVDFLNSKKGAKFDFFYIDPPYKMAEAYDMSIDLIVKNNLLKSYGLIIIEKPLKLEIKIPKELTIQKKWEYSKMSILFLSNL